MDEERIDGYYAERMSEWDWWVLLDGPEMRKPEVIAECHSQEKADLIANALNAYSKLEAPNG